LEFNPSTGQQQIGQVLTNWAASAGTAVIGAGEDYLRTGERDVFFGLGTGQLEMGEFNSSGQADYALSFNNWAVDTATTVVGAGQDLMRSGERDVFFRLGTGQLEMGEFNSSAQADYAMLFTNANGSAFTIDSGTRVVGVGLDASHGNLPDVTLQTGSGAVETVDIPQSSPTTPSSASTVSASAASPSSASSASQASSLIQAMASFPESLGALVATPGGQNDPLVLSLFTNPLHHS
jgi:hypothetical protein